MKVNAEIHKVMLSLLLNPPICGRQIGKKGYDSFIWYLLAMDAYASIRFTEERNYDNIRNFIKEEQNE
jgi:hypothetical protein